MPRAIPPALPHVLPAGMLPSYAVVRSLAVLRSAIRRAYLPTGVWRTPKANCTFSDGLAVFDGWLSFSPPQPGSPIFEPPAQTPPSKSPMNHGPLPAPLPQKAVPKNKVFIVTYAFGSGETLPKSQQHCVPL